MDYCEKEFWREAHLKVILSVKMALFVIQ